MYNQIGTAYPSVQARHSSGNWFICPQPGPQAHMRLFCFPYAGGNAALYLPWARLMPTTIEVVAVQLPGRAERLREPPHTALGPLVESLAAAIEPCLDRPFGFFGHSMGALIAFELARTLQLHYNRRPACLIVSGHRAPQLPAHRPPIHDSPEAELIEQLRHLNGTPREVFEHNELLQLVLPLLRADFAVCESYRYHPAPALACPILALGGLEDRDISREALEAWAIQTTAGCRVRMLPGDHFFLTSARQLVLQVVARELSHQLCPESCNTASP